MTGKEYRTYTMPLYTPLCLVHGCRMAAVSTKGSLTYYRCPVSGCPHTGKAPRVEFTPVTSAVNESAPQR